MDYTKIAGLNPLEPSAVVIASAGEGFSFGRLHKCGEIALQVDYSGLLMADNRRYGLTPQLDIGQILREAQNRWLRPIEVCEILRNYKRFCLSSDPPHKPTDGSLFLFIERLCAIFVKMALTGGRKRMEKQ